MCAGTQGAAASACAAQTGVIFNIQRYSLHDGSGIRTIVFQKGCPLRCAWCANPESQQLAPEIMVREANCIGCGKCLQVCPANALTPVAGKGIARDVSLCTTCGACAAICNSDGISLIGRTVTVGEVFEQLEKDRIFYRHSGGGVTFSGGEPLMQVDFLAAMLRMCKQNALNTVIETCGAAPWDAFERTLADTDMYYYDVKVVDAAAHEHYTGRKNHDILENLERLVRAGKALLVRMPLIPGYNDGQHLNELGTYLSGIGVTDIQLLPYHGYGVGKYSATGRTYALPDAYAPAAELMEAAANALRQHGVHAVTSG